MYSLLHGCVRRAPPGTTTLADGHLLSLQGSGGASTLPLPPHKLSPHDVVDLRANKGDSTGPALASGLVYRVKDDAITVAVEEAPDEGLDQPLRLEKLANEVWEHLLSEGDHCMRDSAITARLMTGGSNIHMPGQICCIHVPG